MKRTVTPSLLLLIAGLALLSAVSTLTTTGHAAPQIGSMAETDSVTHGPILGGPSSTSMEVWVRTSSPGRFTVTATSNSSDDSVIAEGRTSLRRDLSGTATLDDLSPGTRYTYKVYLGNSDKVRASGSFKTLPTRQSAKQAPHNPEGLFNFAFEVGSCNYQNRRLHDDPLMPAYATMLRKEADRIDFQIMDGDFIYEAKRGTSVEEWKKANNVSDEQTPSVVNELPGITGVWENYKYYFERSPNLREWHKNVPTYFVIDDHEILNDVNGTATPGYQERPADYRDIGVQGWRDYVGWANPYPSPQQGDMFHSTGSVESGSDVLVDKSTDFTKIDFDTYTNMTIHSNGKHDARGVYDIMEVLGENRLKIHPAPSAGGENLTYSFGKQNYYSFKVGNSEFFVTDTRTYRELHDRDNPHKEISMLGKRQREWLMEGMENSDADFLFVVSSVTFTIPHVDPDKPEKDESWTTYLHERDMLFEQWKNMDKPVILFSGDLHNSMSIKIDDNLWEFVSGPQNSPNHYAHDAAGRPANGDFTYNGNTVNIRWSSYFMDDVPGKYLNESYYCIVDVKNTFKNRSQDGEVRNVAYSQPYVTVKYYSGETGELVHAETITADAGSE